MSKIAVWVLTVDNERGKWPDESPLKGDEVDR